MNDLANLRKSTSKFLTYFVAGNAVFCLLVGLLLSSASLWYAVIGAAVLTGVAFYAQGKAAEDETARMIIAACVGLSGTVFVSLFSDHAWLIDSHFIFFASIALCVILVCPMSMVACAGVIAVHHLLLNFVAPTLIFPDGTDTLRVLFHAFFVLIETGLLFYFAKKVVGVFKDNAASKQALADTLAAADQSKEEAEQQKFVAENAAREAREALEKLETAQAEKAALSTDLDQQSERARRNIVGDFEAEIGAIISEIANASAALTDNSKAIINQATVGQDNLSTVTHSTNEAALNVQTVAASAEELAASVNEIAQQVSTANETANAAVKRSQETNAQIAELNKEADNIGTVVSLIQDIAEQTNLLALNATIEAARAGEAGKGFAVVASEVKSLANQSSKAAEDIYTRISSMQSATTGAVSSIGEITKIIENLSAGSVAIAAAVEEQDAATGEIARSATLASDGTKEASEAVASISMTVQETLQMSGSLSDLAESFTLLIESLENGSRQFIDKMSGQ